jgi:hypothetical protein
MPKKTISLGDFLTDEEINTAIKICKIGGENGDNINKTLVRRIIEPNLDRINKALGQENDKYYLGYVVEFICTNVRKPIC